jgi:hypothetical protein
MTLRIESKKWILYRHISDFNLLCEVAVFLKSYSKTTISKEEKARLNLKLKEVGLYSERNPDLPLDAINHKINQLSYFMFGYKAKVEGEARFLYSPLGNLFLKNIDDKEKSAKIFLTMLWALQYQHPQSGTDKDFRLYPFRLIFKLLSDVRLSKKLYAFEVAYKVVFIEEITFESYERLVQELIALRQLSNEELALKFQENSHAYVNSAYEWDYYHSTLLEGAGVIDRKEGIVVCKLQHGKTPANGKPTFRKITRNEVSISENISSLVSKLQNQYSYAAKPLLLNDSERLKIDVIKEIYSFFPRILLEEIGELVDAFKLELLNLPNLIEQYSNNTAGGEAYLFEDVLMEGFNLFYNIEVKKIGGAGNTDLECLYLTKKKKFAVEAKSTKTR